MYTIKGKAGGTRLVMLPANEGHRWRFMQRVGGELLPVKLQRAGAKLVAIIAGSLLVYKKPHPVAYGNEVIKANRLKYWSGTDAPMDYDMILDNMLEFIEEV